MASISIFGLGYVGCVGTACLAKLGHKVIGFDVDQLKIGQLAKGKPTIVEREIDELTQAGFEAGLISATSSVEEAVLNSEISFICVGTPNARDGQLDTSYLLEAAKSIGRALKGKSEFHIVVIRSTVPPGTNEQVASLIGKISGKQVNRGFAVVSNPEFLREGTAVSDFLNPPLTVLGTTSARARKILHELYEPLKSEIIDVNPKVAEIIKFVNNSYHALKVTFGNEVGSICKQLGIDSHEVMDLFAKDTQLNISPYYFKPGFAYGGSCLPKDLKGLNYLANSHQVRVPVLASISVSNDMHINRVLQQAGQFGVKAIGIIGLTFKAGTDDLRNSAAIKLSEAILGKGYKVSIYDRYLNIARETEQNEAMLEKHIPHLLPLLEPDVESVIKKSKLVIITVRNPELPDLIRKYSGVTFLDLVRLKDSSVEALANYEGLCW